jgi:hypothetical protein
MLHKQRVAVCPQIRRRIPLGAQLQRMRSSLMDALVAYVTCPQALYFCVPIPVSQRTSGEEAFQRIGSYRERLNIDYRHYPGRKERWDGCE